MKNESFEAKMDNVLLYQTRFPAYEFLEPLRNKCTKGSEFLQNQYSFLFTNT